MPVRHPLCTALAALGGALPVLALLLFPLLTAAAGPRPDARNSAEPLRVALLLEHSGGDHGWVDVLLAGLSRAQQELPVRTQALAAAPEQDLQEMFRNAAREFDLVLVASGRFHEILRNNAGNFRQTMFGCIDAGVRASNIMSITFADEQAAFLAGAAAAMLTGQTALPGVNKEKIIGWLSGEDVPALRTLLDGFSQGARLVDPETRVIQAVTGSFADANAGAREAARLLDQGVDVLVLAAGMGNAPALAQVRARGAYAVGLDADQDRQLPGRVLTSIVKRADQAVYEIIRAAADGRFQGREILVYDLKNQGVGITNMTLFNAAAGSNAPPDMARRLRELRAEILNHSIRLKSLRARTLCDCL